MRTLKQKVDVQAPQRLGHQNASKTCTLSTKVRRKCVPLSRKSMSQVAYAYIALQAYKSVKNAYPLPKSRSKMRTLRQKVARSSGILRAAKNAYPSTKSKAAQNVHPSTESASKTRTLRQKVDVEKAKTQTLRQKVRRKC